MRTLFFIVVLCFSNIATAGELTLSGEGKVVATANVGYINVGVVTEEAVAATAIFKNGFLMNELLKSLKSQKILDTDIQTLEYSVQPKFVYRMNEEPKFVGYIVSNQVRVTVNDLPNMGSVIDSVTVSGSNKINGIFFGVKNPKHLLDNARTLASQDVKSKAELYSSSLGFKLGKYKHISESVNNFNPRPRSMAMVAEASPSGTVISGGELTFSVIVNVTWETLD